MGGGLNIETSIYCILIKHLNRFEGILSQVLPHQFDLIQYISSRRDYMAAYGICLENIQEFARTGPDEFSSRIVSKNTNRLRHQRYGVAARIGDPAGKHRNKTLRFRR